MTTPIMESNLIIKEEFNFINGKTNTDRYIKNKIKEIKEIVSDSDIDDFIKKASDKVNFIKKTGLIDQFDNLIIYLKLNPKDYEVDFKNLVRIRNNIYHGKLPNIDLKPYNSQMFKLAYDMIIKIIAK